MDKPQLVIHQENVDVATLVSGTLTYNFFQQNPNATVGTNYKKMPFPMTNNKIIGLRASLDVTALTQAQFIEYQNSNVNFKVDQIDFGNFSLSLLLRFNAIAVATAPAMNICCGASFFNLKVPIDITNQNVLYVQAVFAAMTQTSKLKMHLSTLSSDNVIKLGV